MEGKMIYHLNDRTLKYQIFAQSKRLHQYLELPGEFKAHYPQEVIFPNMDSGRMDALYSTDMGLLVNLEEESASIGEKTYEKFGKYAIFVSYMYSKNLYIAVICHKDPKKEFKVLNCHLRFVL